jgi:acyl-CoA reductase-like NAD-dependent aldehyde dehydrogenase
VQAAPLRPGTESEIDCREPATRAPLGTVEVDNPNRVGEKIALARRAQVGWAGSSFAERKRVLGRVRAHLVEHADELVELICRDSGKTRENALTGEIWPVCEKLRWTAAHGARHLKPERVPVGALPHKKGRLEFKPLGVIGAIIPWNYPLQNIMNPAIPALMAGNGIVIKPSEWVAWSSERFVEILREAVAAEGYSRELVQLVQGYGETGRALVEGGVDGVVFIGSVANGRRVVEASAKRLVPVVMELGGKDPFIVCEDAHLESAVHAALGGTFINCGQNCVASERILLMEPIADAFEAQVERFVSAFRQGPPLTGELIDVGAMITPLQLDLVEQLVQRAIEEGARVVCGGHRVRENEGDFFAPTILADVTPEMEIMREEVFGPVMLLCRVRDDAHAIEVANDTSFGLSSSVFSKDRQRANRIAAALHAGMSAINDFGGITYMAQGLTFGGVKQSGFGRMNGREGLRSLCNVKAVLDDRLPLSIPSKLYPVTPKFYPTVRGVVKLLYGTGAKRLDGIKDLISSLWAR